MIRELSGRNHLQDSIAEPYMRQPAGFEVCRKSRWLVVDACVDVGDLLGIQRGGFRVRVLTTNHDCHAVAVHQCRSSSGVICGAVVAVRNAAVLLAAAVLAGVAAIAGR